MEPGGGLSSMIGPGVDIHHKKGSRYAGLCNQMLSVEICGVLAQLELCSLKGRGSGIKVGCWVSSKRQWQAGRVQRVVRSQGWGH